MLSPCKIIRALISGNTVCSHSEDNGRQSRPPLFSVAAKSCVDAVFPGGELVSSPVQSAPVASRRHYQERQCAQQALILRHGGIAGKNGGSIHKHAYRGRQDHQGNEDGRTNADYQHAQFIRGRAHRVSTDTIGKAQ